MSVKRFYWDTPSEYGHAEEHPEGELVWWTDYAKLEADYSALLASTQWRPIETAPKDGTDVLLNREGYFRVGSWCYDEGEPARTVWECGGFLLHDPTHWMPIQKPPQEGKQP